jgi:hypothetical protein
MKKRTQIQIAIDALKKHQENFRKEYNKAVALKEEAEKGIKFFADQMDKVHKQIQTIEGTNAGDTV